ncbi:MAG: Fic family protein [Cyclobacteriaceae bacterium]
MFGQIIREARKKKKINLRELSNFTGIDQTLISRIEREDRMPTEGQLIILAENLSLELNELKKEWLTEKVLSIIKYSPFADEILAVAESRIEYLSRGDMYQIQEFSEETLRMLEEIDHLLLRWKKKQPLSISQKGKMEEYFDVAYTFESNRIEGNTLTLQETKMVTVEGLTIGGKSLKEHLEAVNHQEAISFIKDLANKNEPISKRILLEIHRLVLKEVDTVNAGVYRNVPVRISGSKHEPPQPYLLDKLMEDFFEFYRYQEERVHPVILAAEVHERLVSIHPFIDGNGRTARLLMNLVLIRNGYPRVNIKGDTSARMRYYQSLEHVQVDNNRLPFYQLVMDEALLALNEHLELT